MALEILNASDDSIYTAVARAALDKVGPSRLDDCCAVVTLI